MEKEILIGNKLLGKGHPTFVIAEMSGNHNMDYNRAERIVRAAKDAGADAIKLQTYTADTITLNSDKTMFRLAEDSLWAGQTLYELYEKAYTPWEWQPKLKKLADELGILLFSSPFDESSVDFLEEMGVPAYKVASFEINDVGLVRKIARTGKPIIISTGIASIEDIDLALKVCIEEGNHKVVLLKCTSEYPSPYDDMNLYAINLLEERYDCVVGLSDHTMGEEVAVASVAIGAKVIEKHFTLKRADGGVDADFSMEVDEMMSMIKHIRNVEKALGNKDVKLECIQKGYENGGRSLFVCKDIKKGDVFSRENIKSVRPGNGLHTKYLDQVLGKKATRDLEFAKPLEVNDIEW